VLIIYVASPIDFVCLNLGGRKSKLFEYAWSYGVGERHSAAAMFLVMRDIPQFVC
jgi:hypothetical protein